MSHTRTLFLDSPRLHTSGVGEWTALFPGSIRLGPKGSHIRASLTLFSYINTIPNVKAGANQVSLTVGGDTFESTIAPGQYSAGDLITQLNTMGSGVTWEFNTNTLHFVLTSTSSFTLSGSMLPTLGFSQSSVAATLSAGTYTVESDLLCDLSGPQFIQISTSLKTQNIVNEDEASNRVLARIPAGNFGELVTYGSEQTMFSTIKEHAIEELKISINDDQGDPVDFQGVPWHASLYLEAQIDPSFKELTEHYQESDETTEMTKESIPVK